MKTKLFILFLLIAGTSHSQMLRYNAGYAYLYSQQLDRAIQTYNFSRPNLSEKQPLLQHGLQGGISYLFKSENNWQHGLGFNYTFHTSVASNPNARVRLNYQMFDIGYIANVQSKSEKFNAEIGISGVAGVMNRKLNGATFKSDDSPVRSLQFGGLVRVQLGYAINIGNNAKLSPFAGLSFAPYFSEGQSEIVINQTSTLLDEEYTTFFRVELGCRFHFLKK